MSNPNLKKLLAEIDRLKQELEQERVKRKNADQAYEYLVLQYNQLARTQFGSKSEKYEDSDHPQQSLFDEPQIESEANSTANTDSNIVDITAYKRRKSHSNKEPVKRVVIIPAKNKMCCCGKLKKVIRHEVREYPAIFEKIKQATHYWHTSLSVSLLIDSLSIILRNDSCSDLALISHEHRWPIG